jgi:benzoyl-CoA reductase/2-hydroxyglutaryl-CoA dehydratase subunit BcrC/BadD/HgdB
MSEKYQPKTVQQLRAIFGLGHKVNAGKEELEEMAGKRLSLLSFDEANELIKRLGGDPITTSGSREPRRTVNYRRQQVGVKQIAQHNHLKLLRDLADGRNMSEEGLQNLCRRMIGHPRPITTSETNKVIEAIKAMNARDEKQRAKEAA